MQEYTKVILLKLNKPRFLDDFSNINSNDLYY